jgi:hypothetical protein
MLPHGAIVKNMSAVIYDGLSGSYYIKIEFFREQKAPPRVPPLMELWLQSYSMILVHQDLSSNSMIQ